MDNDGRRRVSATMIEVARFKTPSWPLVSDQNKLRPLIAARGESWDAITCDCASKLFVLWQSPLHRYRDPATTLHSSLKLNLLDLQLQDQSAREMQMRRT
jgi:hypothetical protein